MKRKKVRRATAAPAVAIGVILTGIFVSISSPFAFAQIKAFPQAEGFGAAAIGGRGGDVYHVTNLADNGTGSLRYGIDNAPSTGRTIVFDIGGWINLNSKLGVVSTKRNITIAGQTAPGGIGLRGNQFSVGGDDIVVRHMTFRPGKGAGRVDSVNINADAQDVVFDHVSAGFSHDENFSLQATDVSVQFSTVSYGLQDHSAGSLIEQAHKLSMHHNLYAHNNTRNPKARVNETLDWINNVVYDYNIGFIAGDSDTTTSFWTANVDGNYYITGPNDVNTAMITDGHANNFGLYFGTNAYDGDGDTVHDGVIYTGSSRTLGDIVRGTFTFSPVPYAVDDPIWQDASPQAAYERVLGEFGATPWARGEVDQRLYSNVVNRQGGIISHENQLAGISDGGFGALGGGVQQADTDRDGMPDKWEIKYGLSPTVANNNGDFDGDGFTDLEEYLNDVAAFKAAGPLEFEGSGRYADWSNWTRRWEPSRVDEVHVNQGVAIVDATGQRAGQLKIGTETGSSGELRVESGWLEVTDDIVIGDDNASGLLTLAGGRLSAQKLSKGAGGSFEFTGGKLSVGEIDFDLVNEGGLIAPGNSPGQMSILGGLSILSGAMEIELASASLFDKINVDGPVMLGGTLAVGLLDQYAPASGRWKILSATGPISGKFGRITAGYEVQIREGSLYLVKAPEPAAWLILAIGCVGGGMFSRRGRRVRGRCEGAVPARQCS